MDGYLVTSSSQGDGKDLTRHDSVRRNLASEIGSSIDNGLDKQAVSEAQGLHHSRDTRLGLVNEVVMVDGHVQENNCSDLRHGAEKAEITQFKAEFLSLFCRYFFGIAVSLCEYHSLHGHL